MPVARRMIGDDPFCRLQMLGNLAVTIDPRLANVFEQADGQVLIDRAAAFAIGSRLPPSSRGCAP